jgi:Uma2 family endonuclease
MNIALRKPMTREDFLLWAEGQEGRYEFDGVQPVGMTAGTNNHGTISNNLNFQLTLRLENSPCRSMPPEGGGVATIGGKVRSPEATVTCSKIRGRDRLIPNPVIVFEVISESTRRIDQVEKLREYHAVATIKRYVIIEQTGVAITVHARQGHEPWTTMPYGAGDVLDLPEIGIQLPVDLLYRNVDFDEDQDVAPAT